MSWKLFVNASGFSIQYANWPCAVNAFDLVLLLNSYCVMCEYSSNIASSLNEFNILKWPHYYV